MTTQNALQIESNLKNYYLGEKEKRPWGFFEVLDLGIMDHEEFCEKRIEVLPRKALSLQRHQLRREVWNVECGELTVILNGEIHKLCAGESIYIPLRAVHCMINLTDEKVIVHERQTGVCREEDNDRLSDINGRDTEEIALDDEKAMISRAIYEKLTKSLRPLTF